MATTIPNPVRALWGYLHGDDLKAADARAVAHHAARPAGRAPSTEETTSARVPTRGADTGTLRRAVE
jgi:hypothetical protein